MRHDVKLRWGYATVVVLVVVAVAYMVMFR